MEKFSSQITFLNVRDFQSGKYFASQILGLTSAYDIGWAVVYRISGGAFLGIVDHSKSSVPAGPQDGMLISLTTSEIEAWHEKISKELGSSVSPIREITDAGLKSFFFTGPEGYHFEIQQFMPPDAKAIF